ncbi:hypothetical protein SXCC_04271 [Gluconacetobacter sp. SXCC-1]|nr:hypothetical protein SXCC_04271 [Gluconacetobacter sp. SXCC-1]
MRARPDRAPITENYGNRHSTRDLAAPIIAASSSFHTSHRTGPFRDSTSQDMPAFLRCDQPVGNQSASPVASTGGPYQDQRVISALRHSSFPASR